MDESINGAARTGEIQETFSTICSKSWSMEIPNDRLKRKIDGKREKLSLAMVAIMMLKGNDCPAEVCRSEVLYPVQGETVADALLYAHCISYE
jgi:hypothetical protein